MRHVVGWLAVFVPLWWFWLLLAGEWNHDEWIAATAAAALAATVVEIGRTRAHIDSGISPSRLPELLLGVLMIVPDFALLVAALVTRRRGRFQTRSARNASSEGDRVWTSYVATFSPNAYVVELTEERVLVHRLFRWRRSEEPA